MYIMFNILQERCINTMLHSFVALYYINYKLGYNWDQKKSSNQIHYITLLGAHLMPPGSKTAFHHFMICINFTKPFSLTFISSVLQMVCFEPSITRQVEDGGENLTKQ